MSKNLVETRFEESLARLLDSVRRESPNYHDTAELLAELADVAALISEYKYLEAVHIRNSAASKN